LIYKSIECVTIGWMVKVVRLIENNKDFEGYLHTLLCPKERWSRVSSSNSTFLWFQSLIVKRIDANRQCLKRKRESSSWLWIGASQENRVQSFSANSMFKKCWKKRRASIDVVDPWQMKYLNNGIETKIEDERWLMVDLYQTVRDDYVN